MSDDRYDDESGEDEGTDSVQAPPEARSPGRMLQEARERQGLSLDELAAQTLLARSTLEALEANDFERLSQPVFVRGYYRKCAKVLEIPEDAIVDAYASHAGVPEPRPASPGQVDVIPQDVTPRSRRALGLILVVLVLLLGLAAVWWLAPRLGGGTDVAPGDGVGESALKPLVGEEQEDADGGSRTAPASEPAEATAPAAPPATRDAAAPEATPADGSDGVTLQLTFEGRSWVQVRDAEGETLLDGIVAAGGQRQLAGTPPYQVALGNAPAVAIRVNGEPVDFRDRILDNNTVRLTLPADDER